MKKHIFSFVRRGAAACGLGPLVLAVLYLILHRSGAVQTLSVPQVCTGIFSLTALAFIAGGMNFLYQIERLPLMIAILIHGSVLYVSYLFTYLVNGWLTWGTVPVLVFSGIFLVGYFVIWAIIHSIVKRNTRWVNEALKKQQSGK